MATKAKKTEQKEYRVTWEIDVMASSVREAAKQALDIMRDPSSMATVFTVAQEGRGRGYHVDLQA